MSNGMTILDKDDLSNQPRFTRPSIIGRGKKSKHFLKNKRAKLVHRPSSITVYGPLVCSDSGNVIAVKTLCGATFASSKKDVLRFTNEIIESDVVCARCEEIAKNLNKPSASDLVGHDVSVGGVRLWSETK